LSRPRRRNWWKPRAFPLLADILAVQGANPEEVSADAGYCDDKNLALLRKQIVEPVFGQIKQLVREAGWRRKDTRQWRRKISLQDLALLTMSRQCRQSVLFLLAWGSLRINRLPAIAHTALASTRLPPRPSFKRPEFIRSRLPTRHLVDDD
jgi:hypothetical protein